MMELSLLVLAMPNGLVMALVFLILMNAPMKQTTVMMAMNQFPVQLLFSIALTLMTTPEELIIVILMQNARTILEDLHVLV